MTASRILSQGLLKKIGAQIIQTKKALSGSRSGAFVTSFYGSGYDFDQLRDYQQGDDIRFIDWKSSARSDKLLVREYRDERSRLTHVLADSSNSMLYGTGSIRVHDVMVEIVAALSLLTRRTHDAVGVHSMTNQLDMSIPPQATQQSGLAFLSKLNHEDLRDNKQTSLKQSLGQFARQFRKKSLLFIVSDFIDTDDSYETPLKILAQRHELAIIRLHDHAELQALSFCPGIILQDSESKTHYSISSQSDVDRCQKTIELMRLKQERLFKRLKIPYCDCSTNGQHIEQLLMFIRRYFRSGIYG